MAIGWCQKKKKKKNVLLRLIGKHYRIRTAPATTMVLAGTAISGTALSSRGTIRQCWWPLAPGTATCWTRRRAEGIFRPAWSRTRAIQAVGKQIEPAAVVAGTCPSPVRSFHRPGTCRFSMNATAASVSRQRRGEAARLELSRRISSACRSDCPRESLRW